VKLQLSNIVGKITVVTSSFILERPRADRVFIGVWQLVKNGENIVVAPVSLLFCCPLQKCADDLKPTGRR